MAEIVLFSFSNLGYSPVFVHSGFCSFGFLFIRVFVHSGFCSFGFLFIRVFVHSGVCSFRCLFIVCSFVHSRKCVSYDAYESPPS